jgi:hypothetical protein
MATTECDRITRALRRRPAPRRLGTLEILGRSGQPRRQQNGWWGGWGSNPRLADYEKPGLALRVRWLHGCHRSTLP